MDNKKELIGIIKTTSSLVGHIQLPKIIDRNDINIYDGDYNVTQSIDSQILETKNKRMIENVNIFPIPYYEVSNNKNGETIVIGKEIEIYGN